MVLFKKNNDIFQLDCFVKGVKLVEIELFEEDVYICIFVNNLIGMYVMLVCILKLKKYLYV